MNTFSEKSMEDAIVNNPEKFINEKGLRLLARQYRVGSYVFDLLFETRHSGKLIVEIQKGTLDRTHTYKILDYYHEYKEKNPKDYIDIMIVANTIPPERKRRLDDLGVDYKELPESLFIIDQLEILEHQSATKPVPSINIDFLQQKSFEGIKYNVDFNEKLKSPDNYNSFKDILPTCFKIDKANAKALIYGYEKEGHLIHQSIYCAVKRLTLPGLITYDKTKTKFKLSQIGSGLNSNNAPLRIKYIADFVKEYYIDNTIELWNKICNNGLFDIWLPEAPYKRFKDAAESKSHKYRIVLLRIYEIEETFEDSDIKHATPWIDKIKDNTKLQVTIKKPVIDDLTFVEIRDLLEESINSFQSTRNQ